MIELLFILLLLAPVFWMWRGNHLHWQRITLSDEDKVFLEQREFTQRQIVEYFSVPPCKVGDRHVVRIEEES